MKSQIELRWNTIGRSKGAPAPPHRPRWILRSFLLCLALLLPGASGSASAEEEGEPKREPPRNWHATTIVTGTGGFRMINYWSEGVNMRAETLISGHPIRTLVRADRYIVLDPLRRVGLDIGRSDEARRDDKTRLRPFGNEFDEMIADGAEKIEETVASGIPAEVWRITDTVGRRTVWATRETPRIPLRVQLFDRASGQTVDTSYSNWSFNLDIAPGFFATPPGYEMETYSYDEYLAKSSKQPVGKVPVLYPDLLHGAKLR